MGFVSVRVKSIAALLAVLIVFSVQLQPAQAQSCVLTVGSPTMDVGETPHWYTYPLTNNTGGTVDLSGLTLAFDDTQNVITDVGEEFGATWWTGSATVSPAVIPFAPQTIANGATVRVRVTYTGAQQNLVSVSACNAVITSPTVTPTATGTVTATPQPTSTPVATATAAPKAHNSFGILSAVPVVTSAFTIEALPIPTANPTSVAQLSAFNWGVDEMNTIGSVTVTTIKFMDNYKIAWIFVILLAMLVVKWLFEFVTDTKMSKRPIDVTGAAGLYYDAHAAPIERELAELHDARLALQDARRDEIISREDYRIASRQLSTLSAERRTALRENRNRRTATNKLIGFAKRRRR